MLTGDMHITVKKIKVPRFKEELGFRTTAKRSILMSKIRSINTRPELLLRKSLWARGIRYNINVNALPGSPDIVIKKARLAVFVDGEFWHGYNWEEKKKRIKANRKFWIPKIQRNMQRDNENNLMLKKLGYEVLRFWEHQVKKQPVKCISKVMKAIDRTKSAL